jgi:hypothetical protein
VAASSIACFYGPSFAGIMRSNPAGVMDVCLLSALSVVRVFCGRAVHSSRECGVSECDNESLFMRKSWPTAVYCETVIE